MTVDERLDYLERVTRELGEHFDHVQIMVSWNEDAQTHRDFFGTGNWYARQGLAHEFIQFDIAQQNAKEIVERLRGE